MYDLGENFKIDLIKISIKAWESPSLLFEFKIPFCIKYSHKFEQSNNREL